MKLIIVKPLVYSSRLISEQYPEYIEDYDSIFEFMNDHDIKYTKEIVDDRLIIVLLNQIISLSDKYMNIFFRDILWMFRYEMTYHHGDENKFMFNVQ